MVFNGAFTFCKPNNVFHVGANSLCWTGSDIGAQINAAYAALPAIGGEIDIDPQANGACFNYSTPIVFATIGKLPYVRFNGGACLNYVPTTATNAITVDYVPLGLTPAGNHGFENLVLYNNNCKSSQGCGSAAVGIMVGNTNQGDLDAIMLNPTIMGFSVAYQNTNLLADNITFITPNIVANSTGFVLGALTGFELQGGQVAGNSQAIKLTASASIEMSIFGTQFFSNIGDPGIIDATAVVSAAEVDCHDCHFEMQPSAGEHMISGKIDVHMFGGLLVDDNLSAGTGDWFFNLTGNAFDMFGTEILCGRTNMTQAFTVSSAVRSYVNAYFGNTRCSAIVGGAGASKATVNARLPGGSGPTPWLIEPALALASTVSTYDGLTTGGMGVVPVLGTPVHLTGQSADVGPLTIYTTAASGPGAAGTYRVCFNAHTNTSGTGTTSTVTVGWNDGNAKTFASATWALNSVTISGQVNGCQVLFSLASQAITVSTVKGGGSYGTSTYGLDATVEELQ